MNARRARNRTWFSHALAATAPDCFVFPRFVVIRVVRHVFRRSELRSPSSNCRLSIAAELRALKAQIRDGMLQETVARPRCERRRIGFRVRAGSSGDKLIRQACRCSQAAIRTLKGPLQTSGAKGQRSRDPLPTAAKMVDLLQMEAAADPVQGGPATCAQATTAVCAAPAACLLAVNRTRGAAQHH